MDITIHATFLPYDDPDASLAFYRDALGFEVRKDVQANGMRWVTIGPPAQPSTSIILQSPARHPDITDEHRRAILEMMAEGRYAAIILATANLDGAFERLEASGAEVVQEPIKRPDGARDCAFFDPAYNLIRINELRRLPAPEQLTHRACSRSGLKLDAPEPSHDERSRR